MHSMLTIFAGIYVVAFSSMIFGKFNSQFDNSLGKPEKVQATGFLGATKVDEHVSIQLSILQIILTDSSSCK